jgi:translation elongation factor EF-Ts
MYDEDDDENDDEDDEDDCHEFDMMRLAKNTGCRVMLCMMAMGENDHDYDIALDWLIDNGHYTPENS